MTLNNGLARAQVLRAIIPHRQCKQEQTFRLSTATLLLQHSSFDKAHSAKTWAEPRHLCISFALPTLIFLFLLTCVHSFAPFCPSPLHDKPQHPKPSTLLSLSKKIQLSYGGVSHV